MGCDGGVAGIRWGCCRGAGRRRSSSGSRGAAAHTHLTPPHPTLTPTPPPPPAQLGGGGKSAIGEFMKNMRQQNDNFEEQLLKLVRLPCCPAARCRCACAGVLRVACGLCCVPGLPCRVRPAAAARPPMPPPAYDPPTHPPAPASPAGAHVAQGAQVPALRQGAGRTQLRQQPAVLAGRQRRCARPPARLLGAWTGLRGAVRGVAAAALPRHSHLSPSLLPSLPTHRSSPLPLPTHPPRRPLRRQPGEPAAQHCAGLLARLQGPGL